MRKFSFNRSTVSALLTYIPFLSGITGRVKGGVTFSRGAGAQDFQWYQDSNGVWQQVTNGTPAINSKGILLEPASTNKCTCYGTIPADAYGSVRTSGYALVLGVKYEIVSRTTLDFTGVGAANNTVGTQFVATGGTLGAGDSVKDVLYGAGTKSYYTGGSWRQNHQNMSLSMDTAGVVTTVSDTAALAAKHASICPSGKVYKVETTGTGAVLTITGPTGNTNSHTWSLFYRTTGGGATCTLAGDPSQVQVVGSVPDSAEYTRVVFANVTPGSSGKTVTLIVPAGKVLYFFCPQLEESVFASTPMPSQGGTITRAATALSFLTSGNLSDTVGTLYAEVTPTDTSTGTKQVIANNTRLMYYSNNQLKTNDGTSVLTRTTVLTAGTTYKTAVAWGAGTKKLFEGGALLGSSAYDGSWDQGASVSIGPGPTYIKNLRIYRKQLTDAQCVALTQ